MATIKALTLYQPWASLVCIGAKQFETRSWATPYRGKLAIHAGKTLLYDRYDRQFLSRLVRVGIAQPDRLPLGAVLCVCELQAIYRSQELSPTLDEQELAFGNYEPSRAAWKLKVLKVFEPPIPAKGSQGLWDWDCPVELP